MNLHVNRHGIPDVGIIYQRGMMQFWVPSTMQGHLQYNPRHVPAVRTAVLIGVTRVVIFERTKSGSLKRVNGWLRVD